tara:strand:- start:544 stop:807 length:264 start_codon:yes stop_codon:yes gene_type:complete
MPRYQYECSNCQFTKTYFHGFDETIEVCEECQKKTMKKVFTNKFFTFSKGNKKTDKVGNLTKKYIEENRKILEDEKKEAKEETYEPN